MSTIQAGYSAISSYSRVEILHLIQEQPRRTVADLVAETNLHPNTVREHVKRLIDAGFLISETEHRTTRGRPRVLYSAADGSDTSSPVQKKKVRGAAERGDLMRRIMPIGAPEALSVDALHQVDALVEELVEEGYDPFVDEATLSIELTTPCNPAAEQAENREKVCAVHLTLMQAIVSEAGGPLAVDGMRSVCDPRNCIVRLNLRGGD